MKIQNEILLSFTNKEEYLYAVRIWKWNMRQIVNQIRQNNFSLIKTQKYIPVYDDSFFVFEALNQLHSYQLNKITLAKIARNMLKIRAKMKKLAGQQMEQRVIREKDLMVVK